MKAIIPTIDGQIISSFIIVKNNQVYKSKLMNKETAKTEFNNALNNNREAYYVGQSDTYKDILCVEAGNFESNTEVRLEIYTFGELSRWIENNELLTKFILPFNLFPRYGSSYIND